MNLRWWWLQIDYSLNHHRPQCSVGSRCLTHVYWLAVRSLCHMGLFPFGPKLYRSSLLHSGVGGSFVGLSEKLFQLNILTFLLSCSYVGFLVLLSQITTSLLILSTTHLLFGSHWAGAFILEAPRENLLLPTPFFFFLAFTGCLHSLACSPFPHLQS